MKSKGFTLVEVIVAVAISTVVMLAVAAFEYDVLNYNRSSQAALGNVQDAENILKFMSKELRSMSVSAAGGYPIAAAATNTLTFYVDLSGGGTKDQVRYYLASTTLYRGVIEPSGTPPVYSGNESKRILAYGITDSSSTPVFEYFDGSYDGSGAPMPYPLNVSAIRLIRVNMSFADSGHDGLKALKYSSQVSLRNLKDNL